MSNQCSPLDAMVILRRFTLAESAQTNHENYQIIGQSAHFRVAMFVNFGQKCGSSSLSLNLYIRSLRSRSVRLVGQWIWPQVGIITEHISRMSDLQKLCTVI